MPPPQDLRLMEEASLCFPQARGDLQCHILKVDPPRNRRINGDKCPHLNRETVPLFAAGNTDVDGTPFAHFNSVQPDKKLM